MAKFATLEDTKSVTNEMPFVDRLDQKTIYSSLLKTALKFPNRPAITFQLESGPKKSFETYSWKELLDQVTKLANAFRALGVGQNDVIAYILPNCNEAVLTFLSGSVNGVVNPINPLLSSEQISAILRETRAKAVVTLAPMIKTDVSQKVNEALKDAPDVKTLFEVDLVRYLSGVRSLIAKIARPKVKRNHSAKILSLWDAMWAQSSGSLSFKDSHDDRVGAVFHTGGTTGMPKVAQHRVFGMLFNGWTNAHFIMKETDCLICPLPMFHVFAAYPILMTCISSGAHMVMPTPQGYRGDGVFKNFWKLIARWKVTFLVMVPTAATQLMQHKVDADVSTLRYALCGSSPLPVELFKRFQEATGVEIIEGYGMTEATCLISVNPPDGEKKIGSVGLPYPYTEIKILICNDNGSIQKECDIDEVGEVCVFNPGVILNGTYTDPEKNKGLYPDDRFMRTGDLGRIDKDGYLWLTGRAKDLIIRGGHNIDPSLIEDAIAGHQDVVAVGAIGQPDPKSGEVPCAYVQLKDGSKTSAETVREFANQTIGEQAAKPKHVEVLRELPLTNVGKIFKPELRKMAISRVFNEHLDSKDLKSKVVSIRDDKNLGLVACISGGQDEKDKVKKILGNYSIPWEFKDLV